MTVQAFEGRTPRIGAGTWVHPSADVFGDVTIGERCWVGPGARVRGDYGTIEIGPGSAVEDNVVIHARPGGTTSIGEWVTLGHGSIIHTATIRSWATIGMGAIVSDWSEVGVWAVLAEGTVVPRRFVVPERRIALGVPARIIEKLVDDEYVTDWTRYKAIYSDLARRYREGLGPPLETTPHTQA
jgi:carbonic anhydrase/acetyltransferase-like protein (isoleucine patch superfamily)